MLVLCLCVSWGSGVRAGSLFCTCKSFTTIEDSSNYRSVQTPLFKQYRALFLHNQMMKAPVTFLVVLSVASCGLMTVTGAPLQLLC